MANPEVQKEIIRQLSGLIEPLCRSEGMELVFIEYRRESRGRILRLYIDKPGGVTLNDCIFISQQAGDLLDVNFDHYGTYHLEVTSPGSDRPLGKRSDFEKFKGRIAKIKTGKPLDGQKNFRGVLSGVCEDAVQLRIGDKTVLIPFQDIASARLVDDASAASPRKRP